MVFSSIFFLFLFLPLVLLANFLAPKFIRNAILWIFSLVFYAWGEPVYVILMLFSTVFNYVMGLEMCIRDRYDMGNKLGIMQAAVETACNHREIGEDFKLYLKEFVKTL